MPFSSLIATDGERPNRWAITKSGRKRLVMSRTCAPISTPGGGTANVRSSKPSDLGQILEDGQRFLAGRIVVEQVGDLLALEVAAELFLGEGDRRRRLRPVARGNREQIGIALAVGRRRRAEARATCRGSCPRPASWSGPPSAACRRGPCSTAPSFLKRSCASIAGRHLVFVVDLDDADLVAFDAALAIHQGDVVVIAGAQERADRLRGPVRSHCKPNTSSFCCADGSADPSATAQRHRGRATAMSFAYATLNAPPLPLLVFPDLSRRTARPGSSCGCCATAG